MALRSIRETRGLTLEQAAAELAIDPSYLSGLERGLKWPRPDVMQRLVDWTKRRNFPTELFNGLKESVRHGQQSEKEDRQKKRQGKAR